MQLHKTDEYIRIRTRKCMSFPVQHRARIVPQSKAAKLLTWLLGKTKHKVIFNESMRRLECGYIPGHKMDDLLNSILNEYELSMIFNDDLDRIIIGPDEFKRLSCDIDPTHSLAIQHTTEVNQAYDDAGRRRVVRKLCDVRIQVLPNVKGVLFVPRMKA